MPAPSPVQISDPTPKLVITVNGKSISVAFPVVSVNINNEVNRISVAEIVLSDGDLSGGTFPISDSTNFVPGNEVEISAAYGDDAVVSVFKGIVVKQALKVSSTSNSALVVTCKHKAAQMTYARRDEMYAAVKDSDIISAIIGTYGIKATVANTVVTQEMVFQKMATDWDFILSRADFYGHIITLDGDAVTIAEPQVTGTAVLRVALGDSILQFDAELSAEDQAAGVSTSAWDIKNQELVTADAAEPAVNAQGNLTAKQLSGALSQGKMSLNSCTPMANDELKAWADGELLKMRLSSIKGQVSFQGSSLVKPGTLIELAGVGDRYNGNAFVSAVNHVIEEGNWTSHVTFGLNNIPVAESLDISYPPAAGQLPAIHGLQVATVKQIHNDPADEYRVLVTIPSNSSREEGIWARMANFYASSGFGASFIPEIGDEVIVGFLESNPRYPVILGSLYSSAHKMPVTANENNNIKTIITRSRLKISFDDDKKIVKIETPGGNSFTLDDNAQTIQVADQNSNTLRMSSSGIDISSAKDINIKATGNISLNATGKLDLKATQDASITGMNVNHTAQMGFTAKGSTNAELSSSGQTTVKGAIVMIN